MKNRIKIVLVLLISTTGLFAQNNTLPNSGKVGVGTTTPTKQLEVVGETKLVGKVEIDSNVVIKDSLRVQERLIVDQDVKIKGESVFTGNGKFKNDLKILGITKAKDKLVVDGLGRFKGNIKLDGDFIFGNNNRIGYLAPSAGNPEVIGFGKSPSLLPLVDPCFDPSVTTINQFQGTIQTYGNNANGDLNVMSMGFDGSNGIIDLRGSNGGTSPKLLINYYCGKDVAINTGAQGGNVSMTTANLGMVGIGTGSPTAKLDIRGDLRVVDGTQGINKVLTSDADGNATWQTQAALDDGDWTVNGNTVYRNAGQYARFGFGTDTPLEKIQIGDELVIHDGGTKYFARNMHWANGENKRIVDGPVSGLCMGASGTIAMGVAEDDIAGSTIDWNWNVSVKTNGDVGIGTLYPNYQLDVAGDVSIHENTMYFKSENHGVGYFDDFGGQTVQGPVLFGYFGGALAVKQGTTTKNILTWKSNGQVNINSDATQTNKSFTVHDTNSDKDVFRIMNDGHTYATELTIRLKEDFPDYVFANNYELMPLSELNIYIANNQHLPNIPSASEVAKVGLSVGEMQVKQMEKIEELTLYILELNNRLSQLEKENQALKNK